MGAQGKECSWEVGLGGRLQGADERGVGGRRRGALGLGRQTLLEQEKLGGSNCDLRHGGEGQIL